MSTWTGQALNSCPASLQKKKMEDNSEDLGEKRIEVSFVEVGEKTHTQKVAWG